MQKTVRRIGRAAIVRLREFSKKTREASRKACDTRTKQYATIAEYRLHYNCFALKIKKESCFAELLFYTGEET